MKSSLFSRTTALAALLVAAVFLLSGCNLIVKDPAVDARQVVLTINGEDITKEEFTRYYNNTYQQAVQMQQLYQQYGMQPQPINQSQVLEDTFTNTIKDKVLHQQAHKLGLEEMTEEETAAIEKQAEEGFQNILDQVKDFYFADTQLEGDELKTALEEKALELGFDLETFRQSAVEGKLHEKLHDYAGEGIVVSDEELQTGFDEKVAAAKEEYENNPAAFGSALTGGRPVYYTPAGYRAVRQILVKLAEEDTHAITEKEGELSPLKSALDSARVEINRLEGLLKAEDALEDADQAYLNEKLSGWADEDTAAFRELLKKDSLTEEEQQALDAFKAKLADYAALADAQAAHDSKQAELIALQDAAFAKIQEKTDGILAAARAEGADFEALITEYNEDLGQPDTGYAVHAATTTYVPAFTTGAMALEKIGDVSQPIRTNFGYHILRYESDLEEGPAALETVKDSLHEELLSAKQQENYRTLEEKWIAEAEVKRYPERMKD